MTFWQRFSAIRLATSLITLYIDVGQTSFAEEFAQTLVKKRTDLELIEINFRNDMSYLQFELERGSNLKEVPAGELNALIQLVDHVFCQAIRSAEENVYLKTFHVNVATTFTDYHGVFFE